MDKKEFLLEEFCEILLSIDENTKPLFGKMNFGQMVEHFSDSVRIANGKETFDFKQDDAITEKMKNFMLSDKPFRENTPNPLLPDEPEAVKNSSIVKAIEELKMELNDFETYFAKHSDAKLRNPFFGELNFEEWIHLLHKHALHHLKQFGFD